MNGNYGSDPDYVFSELRPVAQSNRVQMPTHELWTGHVSSFATALTDKDFEQARKLWEIIGKEPHGKEQLLHNIIPTLQDIPAGLKKEVLSKSYCMQRNLLKDQTQS
jgi:catalase